MMDRCFFVTGSESSGTRMLVRSFILLDIPELITPRNFDWPYGEIDMSDGDIVIHCGVPLGGEWLNLWTVSKRLRHLKKEVIPLVMVRDWNATANSQVIRGFVNNIAQAEENMRAAYRQITQSLHGYIFISYEQFCLQPKYRAQLFDRLELPDSPIDIHYGNDQYYRDRRR